MAKYDGSDEKLPVYISIRGLVFDVTKGRKHYVCFLFIYLFIYIYDILIPKENIKQIFIDNNFFEYNKLMNKYINIAL